MQRVHLLCDLDNTQRCFLFAQPNTKSLWGILGIKLFPKIEPAKLFGHACDEEGARNSILLDSMGHLFVFIVAAQNKGELYVCILSHAIGFGNLHLFKKFSTRLHF